MLQHRAKPSSLSVPTTPTYPNPVNSRSASTPHITTSSAPPSRDHYHLYGHKPARGDPTTGGAHTPRKRRSLELKPERAAKEGATGTLGRPTFGDTLHVVTENLKRKISLTKRSRGYSSLHEDECTCRQQQVYGSMEIEPSQQTCKVHYHASVASHQTGKTNPME